MDKRINISDIPINIVIKKYYLFPETKLFVRTTPTLEVAQVEAKTICYTQNFSLHSEDKSIEKLVNKYSQDRFWHYEDQAAKKLYLAELEINYGDLENINNCNIECKTWFAYDVEFNIKKD